MNAVQQKSRESNEDPEARLRVVGHFPMRMLQEAAGDQKALQTLLEAAFTRNKKQYPFRAMKVFATPNCLAVLDSRLKLWALIDVVGEPVCLSDMLKLKVHDLALHFTQMVLSTSAGRLLLSWGGRKHFSDKHLNKLPIRNSKFKYAHYFQLHEITKEVSWSDRFYFALPQKLNEDNLLYQLTEQSQTLMLHPSHTTIHFRKKISGISLGKYHNLAWDSQGCLLSWGCRSIALGYSALPEEEVVAEPREVELMKRFVIKAYAGNSYSLAVTLEGKLYEWGINRLQANKEQIIFQPREVPVHSSAKLVDIKGFCDRFAVLALTGELYVWGKNTKKLLKKDSTIRSEEQSTILIPTLLEPKSDFVVDFEVEESCLLLITTNRTAQPFSDSRRAYWNSLKDSIQLNLRGNTLPAKLRLSSSEQRSKIDSPLLPPTLRKFTDPIQLAFQRRKAKQNYLASAIEPDSTINYLMQPSERIHYMSTATAEGPEEQETQDSSGRGRRWRLATAAEELNNDVRREQKYVQALMNRVEVAQSKNRLIKFNRNRPHPALPTSSRANDVNYDARLEAVRKKRQEMERCFIEETLSKVENRSFEYRMARKYQGEKAKQHAIQIQNVKVSLQRLLVKQFLARMLVGPVREGREVKIASFARYLKLERIEKRIRGLFIRARVQFNMRRLHQSQVFRFFLLTMTFQQYVKRFRAKKAVALRGIAVREVFMGVMRQKLKIGVAACHFSVRKLQKFRQWLALVRNERRRCLKSIWKVQLLSLMKLNAESESSAIVYLPKNPDMLTFQALYQEQVILNPLLKLSVFLNHHSIFKIKTTIFQQLFVLSRNDSKGHKDKRLSKAVKALGRSKRFRIRFSEEEQDKQDRLNLLQTDIYPYSTHYNLLIHPKNYDITIPEIMKVSDRWAKEERRILDKHIDMIITAHEERMLTLRRTHDRQLACYIASHYDSISEKRWKYILEYNQLDRSAPRAKKEREVRRLMRLIGAQKLLDGDCIPQKQAILDEVAKRPDAPRLPNPNIIFGPAEFRKLFKAYYQTVAGRAKEIRRTFL